MLVALVEFEMLEITNAIELEKTINAKTSYADMWKTKGNRHRLFITLTLGIFSQWSGGGVVSALILCAPYRSHIISDWSLRLSASPM